MLKAQLELAYLSFALKIIKQVYYGRLVASITDLFYISHFYDALGSVIGLEGQDGSMSARYRYDEFGIVKDPEKFDLNWPGPDNLFGYTSLGYDYYSGYSHAQARDFDSSIGRFISEDTYEGELDDPLSQNLYAYVQNNPLRYTDPSGHMAVPLLRIISNWYNKKYINQKQTSALTLVSNGFGIYTALHEIAQINIAKKLYESGKRPTLEFSIKGANKEIDIVSGNQAWEIKSIGSFTSVSSKNKARNQLNNYISLAKLKLGDIQKAITDIPVVSNIKMKIQFPEKGIATYSFDRKTNTGQLEPVPIAKVKKEIRTKMIKAVAVTATVIGLTAIEDIMTGGAGVADDIPSVAFAMNRVGAIFGY